MVTRLSKGKINLRLDYLKERDKLVYERRLEDYEQELEKELKEPERSEKIFIAMEGGIKYIREHYDWEKEKIQAKAIGRRTRIIGNLVKTLAQKEWEKEKYVMKELIGELKQIKGELMQRKKEKLFLKFSKLKNEMAKIDNQVSKLDPEKNYNYTNNLKWQNDKLYEDVEKVEDKLRKEGYPF